MTGNGNVKEACEVLAWDMEDNGLQVRWRYHQSADSSAHVLLMNAPPVLDRGGIEIKIMWNLDRKRFVEERAPPHGVHWCSSP